jgi:hypothetical protein
MHPQRPVAPWVVRALLAGFLLGFAVPQAATGEEKILLRWDLPEGSLWEVQVHQRGESRVGFSGKVAETRYNLTMHLAMRVVARQQDLMTIHQTVERIVMDLNLPAGTALRFDSASQERPPSGPAADLAAAVRPLVGATFELVHNRRGEVESVQPRGQVAEQWVARFPSDQGQAAWLKRAFTQAVGQCLGTLPQEAITPQDTWEHVRTEETPLGEVQVRTTYRLDRPSPQEQPQDQEDKSLWPIRFTSEVVLPSPAPDETKPAASPAQPGSDPPPLAPGSSRRNPIQVKQFQQSGTVWFSAQQSRPVAADLQTRLSLTQVYRDLTITADTTLQQQVTLQPKVAPRPINGPTSSPGTSP